MSLLIGLLACLTPETGNETALGPGPSSGTDDSESTTGTDDSGGSDEDSGWWNQKPGDADEDGYTAEQGDCDDGDPNVNPGETDFCDDQDNDCDDDVDEDFDGDPYEPNETSGYDAGDLGTEGEVILYPYIFPDDDTDRFMFYVEDGTWSWFDIEVWLYDVPSDADFALQLSWIEDIDGDHNGIVDSADENGRGGDELVNYGGSTGFDDTGWYEVKVTSSEGESCNTPYTLQILVGGW